MEYQAIVLGAGNSTRSGLLYNKVLFELNNIPIIYFNRFKNNVFIILVILIIWISHFYHLPLFVLIFSFKPFL